MSRRGPTCRSARSRHGTAIALIEGHASRSASCSQAARAPTTSATSPATRRPASAPDELLDTRPYAKRVALSTSSTIAPSTACRASSTSPSTAAVAIPTLEDTNDIGFQAVEVTRRRRPASSPASTSASMLGGITGHRDLARDTGVDSAIPADATARSPMPSSRVFIDDGRPHQPRQGAPQIRARFLGLRQIRRRRRGETRPRTLPRVDAAHVAPRPVHDRHGHIGVHPPKAADGLSFIGVVLARSARCSADQMRDALAAIARRVSGTATSASPSGRTSSSPACRTTSSTRPRRGSRRWPASITSATSSIRAGLVACTGSQRLQIRGGSDTKKPRGGHRCPSPRAACHTRHARSTSISPAATTACAQHYIGDIGSHRRARRSINEDGDTVDGYDISWSAAAIGAQRAAIGRDLLAEVSRPSDAPQRHRTAASRPISPGVQRPGSRPSRPSPQASTRRP